METALTQSIVLNSPLSSDEHPAMVYIARLSAGSRRTMHEALDTIAGLLTSGACNAETLNWSALRYQHTQAVRSALAQRYSPATVNKMVAALRGVLREAWRLGQMDAESYSRAVDLQAVKGTTLPRGRALGAGEVRSLFHACGADKGAAAIRDAAMLAVLYGGGLRREELVNLDLEDFNTETGELIIRAGKGNKDRTAYATNGAALALAAWLRIRGNEPGPLYLPVNKGGRVVLRRMTPQAVYYVIQVRAREAGVQHLSPHDLRRSFVSDLLDAGADISTVQHLAGHANVQTTARYDRRGEAAKRKAVELLHVPFQG